jgi:membrane protease subunit (stomatin/prohibitin family)
MTLKQFVQSGVGELMLARPPDSKDDLIAKHPWDSFGHWAALTVDTGESLVFMRDGRSVGMLGPGRYNLDAGQMPFLTPLWDAAAQQYRADMYFVTIGPVSDNKFGTTGQFGADNVSVFGSYTMVATDPQRIADTLAGLGDIEAVNLLANMHVSREVKEAMARCHTEAGYTIDMLAHATRWISQTAAQGCAALLERGLHVVSIDALKVRRDA